VCDTAFRNFPFSYSKTHTEFRIIELFMPLQRKEAGEPALESILERNFLCPCESSQHQKTDKDGMSVMSVSVQQTSLL
jgi:hypothetical protein